MSEIKNYFWTFPLLGGILIIIGLLTPFSMAEGTFNWLWGFNYFEFAGDAHLNWIFNLDFGDFTASIIAINYIFLSILFVCAILSIFYSLKLWKKGDFQRDQKKWLILGILIIISTIIYLISFEILMRAYYHEEFDIKASYWDYLNPGFALIAPFISGGIIITGFIVNKYVLPKKRDWYDKLKDLYRNIIYTFILGISIFFIGTLIIFTIFILIPGDNVVAYLSAVGISHPSEELIQVMKHQLGLDQSVFVQYFRFLGDLLTGSKGWISVSLARNRTVFQLVGGETVSFINFMIAPLFLSLFFGFLLGKISSWKRYSKLDNGIQIFSIFGLSLPIFFFGMLIQFFICYKADLCDPSGNYQLAFLVFAFTTITLIVWQTRRSSIKSPDEKSLISNSVNTGIIFGFIFLFYILTDITFGLSDFGNLIVTSIILNDFYLIARSLFIIIILLAIVVVISNIIFSIHKFIAKKSINTISNPIIHKNLEMERDNIKGIKKEEIKNFIFKKLKSPIFIIGSIFVIFIVFISLFPQLITKYSIQEATSPMSGQWSPPSSEHPLGQTSMGYDILALIIWGIRDAVILGVGTILIGFGGSILFGALVWISNYIKSHIKGRILLTLFGMLIYGISIGLIIFLFMFPVFGIPSIIFSIIIGLIVGIVIGLIFLITSYVKSSNDSAIFNTKVESTILGLMILFYIFPGIIFLLLFIQILGSQYWVILYYLGIFSIPGFTFTITKAMSRKRYYKKLIKSIIIYIPLGIAFTLIIYFAIGFLGFLGFTSSLNLGITFGIGRANPYGAPWAWIWPGITIFGMLFSLLLLHIGLKINKTIRF
jgi:ABC-type dipeptide/oligopeptide/nickel transport system permease component/ABC-type dipeptide/oligopeptide/nickel transport system permease subunit